MSLTSIFMGPSKSLNVRDTSHKAVLVSIRHGGYVADGHGGIKIRQRDLCMHAGEYIVHVSYFNKGKQTQL